MDFTRTGGKLDQQHIKLRYTLRAVLLNHHTVIVLFKDWEQITSIDQSYQMIIFSTCSCLHVHETTSPT